MYFDNEDPLGPELFSEIDVFLNRTSIEEVDISLKQEDFNYVSLKLPPDSIEDMEELLNEIEHKNQSKYYIVTTFVSYLDAPELKKYYVPYARINDFLYTVNEPEYDERIINIVQAEEDYD